MVSMSAVWDRTVEFLSDNLAQVVPIALVLLFVPSAISGALQPLVADAGQGERLGLSIVSLVLSLISVWGNLAVIALAIDPGLATREAVTAAGRRMPAAVAVIFVGLLAVVLLWTPLLVIIGVSGGNPQTMTTTGVPQGARAAVGLAMLVLVPLTLWLAVRAMVLVSPVLVAERRGLRSLTRAWALTRGIGWRVLGVLFLYLVLSWVIVTATRTVVGTVLRLLTDGDGPLSLAAILTSVMVGAVATGLTVTAAAFSAKLYVAVRDAREGTAQPA